MIYIRIKNQYIDLPDDFRVDLIIENPLFLQDRIPAPYTTSSEFPLTAGNKALLDNPDRVNLSKEIRTWEYDSAILGFGPRVLYYGIVIIREIRGRISFNFQASDDLSILRKNMNEIEWGIIPFTQGTYTMRTNPQWGVGLPSFSVDIPMAVYKAKWESARDGLEPWSAAPIKTTNIDFPTAFDGSLVVYVNSLYGQNQFFNPVANTFGYIIPLELNISGDVIRYAHSPIYPQMRVHHFLKTLLDLTDERNPFSEGDLYKVVLTSHWHKMFRNDLVQKWSGVILDNDYPAFADPEEEFILKISSYQAAFPSNEVLKGVLNTFCATLFRVQEGPQLVNVVKFNRDIIQDVSFVDWDSRLGSKLVLSRESAQNYLYGYDDFKEGVAPVDPEFTVQNITDLISATVDPVTNERLYYIRSTNQLILKKLRPKLNSFSPDEFSYEVKHNGFGSAQSDGGYRISSVISPMKMQPTENIDLFASVQAKPQLLAYLPIYEGSRSVEYKPHMMIYWGNIENRLNPPLQLPYLSYHNYDAGGTRLGDLSLQWDGEDGLIETHHRQFKQWIESDRLLAYGEFIISPHGIKDIDLSQKVMVRNRLWWIKKMVVPLSKKKIDPIQTDLIEAPLPDIIYDGSGSGSIGGSGSGSGSGEQEPTGTCYTVIIDESIFEEESMEISIKRPGEAPIRQSYTTYSSFINLNFTNIYFCSEVEPIFFVNDIASSPPNGVNVEPGGSCMIDSDCSL
ncbi:hypothetical protein [Mongoliitalea lutea]|uniref:Uncharacterized protein n=1 Tax=Mongoliitalea lutea TaxID=849756 RepID=A0A8J3G5Z4_9BACT|nr:hypothetical protein [Mongoliitalea lutea]GHB44335.1 hypothetical protein GCM10008106_26730 [Mongoliitalea lutea]